MTNLVKAKLTAAQGEVAGIEAIEFLFNPTQLAFEGVVATSDNAGTGSKKSGKPKVSFSNIEAYKITISNILFDTYEKGGDVLEYIKPFKAAVKFVEGKSRPPIYTFIWGDQIYLKYCFVERVTYKLTMFLPNGVPVRAIVDNLTLKETDGIPSESSQLPGTQPNPADTAAARRSKSRGRR